MRKCIMEEIKPLLSAHIDCIWIHTFEESEVIKDLSELLKSETKFANMILKTWSRTEGVVTVPVNKFLEPDPPDTKLREFPALFNVIAQKQGGDPSIREQIIWVLRDFDTVITDPKCQRYIRDLKEYRSLAYNPLIVVSSTVEIPSSVAHLFRVVEYDLPDRNMIRELARQQNEHLAAFAEKHPDMPCHVSNDEELDQITNACMGLTIKEANMALKESLTRFKGLNLDFLAKNKIDMVKKTGVLDYKIPQLGLEDIGGNGAIKAWLRQAKEALSPEATAFGVERPRGAMYVGVPGAGKTALAEAFAKELHVPLLELSMSKIMSKLVGESERKIDQALKIVEACAPCVFLLDEVEKMMGGKLELSIL